MRGTVFRVARRSGGSARARDPSLARGRQRWSSVGPFRFGIARCVMRSAVVIPPAGMIDPPATPTPPRLRIQDVIPTAIKNDRWHESFLARRRPPTRRAIPTAEIVGRVNDFGGWYHLSHE